MEKYKSKGNCYFRYNQGKIEYTFIPYFTWRGPTQEHLIYDLMIGEDFQEAVGDGSLIDYDGTLSEIFIDGYRSNLGISYKGIHQGDFMVDGQTFLDLCKEYKVEVNWANK